jgi:hypothetical protein
VHTTHLNDFATIAAAVRAACVETAIQAYEDAGMRGLCHEGRWESAIAAMRRLDLTVLEDGAAAARSIKGRERNAQ